jgi:hypothetical protein
MPCDETTLRSGLSALPGSLLLPELGGPRLANPAGSLGCGVNAPGVELCVAGRMAVDRPGGRSGTVMLAIYRARYTAAAVRRVALLLCLWGNRAPAGSARK